MRGEALLQKIVDQDFVRDISKPVAEFSSLEKRSDFVAGEGMDDALDHSDKLNKDGVTALVDILGEHVEDPEKADNVTEEYRTLQNSIAENGLDAHISIKPSHIGLDVTEIDGYNFCQDNLYELADNAAEHDQFLWIDMESSDYVDETLNLYTDLLNDGFENAGVCVQSYLKRSERDIADLTEEDDAKVRLVKGAYDEPEEVAYQDWEKVGDSYRDLLEDLFESDTHTAVATHDKELIEYAKDLEEEHDKPRDEWEFQFLTGVREDLKRDLADEGYNVSDYVPYGSDWFDYSWRRVQENPGKNIPRMLKSLV